MMRLVLILGLAACSRHPPDMLINQTIMNPFCIIHCAAENHSPVVKGNVDIQVPPAKR